MNQIQSKTEMIFTLPYRALLQPYERDYLRYTLEKERLRSHWSKSVHALPPLHRLPFRWLPLFG